MAALNPGPENRLAVESRQLLCELAMRPWSDRFYLAGSAALALYLDHRPVRDLDLMSADNRLAGTDRRDLLADLLDLEDGLRVETARDGFLHLRSQQDVGLRLYYYPYPLIGPVDEICDLTVASPIDLGLMKLGAIISRGTRRDFADLYLLCRKLPLAELLERAPAKFPHVRDFPLQALKGLADLSLTAGEPLPRLATPLDWDEVVTWLHHQVRTLGRARFGLD